MSVMKTVLHISCLCFMLIAAPSQGETDTGTHHLEYVTHSEKGFMLLFHGDSKGAAAITNNAPMIFHSNLPIRSMSTNPIFPGLVEQILARYMYKWRRLEYLFR